MRLIDADLLEDKIRQNKDLPWKLDSVSIAAFISCVGHEPTAIDFDEIEKLLNEKAFPVTDCRDKTYKCIPVQTVMKILRLRGK